MRIEKMITKGELRPVLRQFLPTSTVRNALGQIRRICMLILGNKGLMNILQQDISLKWKMYHIFYNRKSKTK